MIGRTSQKKDISLCIKMGFTLIELLVVIAIIAILMAILIPVLSGARRQAKIVACQANLKHWGLILAAYTDDNDGRFFRGMVDGWWNDWIEILEPFHRKMGGLTCCPLATRTADKGGQGVFAAWKDKEGDYGSYGLNGWVCDADPGGIFKDELYWRKAGVSGAENVPVFLDCQGIAGWPDHTSTPPESNGASPQGIALIEQMKNFCINRHGNGVTNCLFMDSSVRTVGLKELWKPKWHQNFNINGPWTKEHVPPPIWPVWMKNFKDY